MLFAYVALLTNILITLLIRIYFSFKESVFYLTKCQINICAVLLIIYLINGCVCVVILAFELDIWYRYKTLWVICFKSAAASYFVLSLYGICLFANKIHRLYRLGEVFHSSDNDGEMDKQQLQLLSTASKYVSLLSFAIFTTLVSTLGYLIICVIFEKQSILEFQIFYMQICIDCAINVMCLYLQFQFATECYIKLCGWFGNLWLYVFKARVKKKSERGTEMTSRVNYSHVATQSNISECNGE